MLIEKHGAMRADFKIKNPYPGLFADEEYILVGELHLNCFAHGLSRYNLYPIFFGEELKNSNGNAKVEIKCCEGETFDDVCIKASNIIRKKLYKLSSLIMEEIAYVE